MDGSGSGHWSAEIFDNYGGHRYWASTYGDSTFNANADAVNPVELQDDGASLTEIACFRIDDDGANRKRYYSDNYGANWVPLGVEADNFWITPTQVGITGFTLAGPSYPGFTITVYSFAITGLLPPP